jgi:hypothetical protein
MATAHSRVQARVGDTLEVRSIHGGQPRHGTVVEVLGGTGHEHFRVHWDEKHESIVYPDDGVLVVGNGRGARPPGRHAG